MKVRTTLTTSVLAAGIMISPVIAGVATADPNPRPPAPTVEDAKFHAKESTARWEIIEQRRAAEGP